MALGALPVLAGSAAAASPLYRRVVFLIGAAGSGAGDLEAALLGVDGFVGHGVPSRLFAGGIDEVLTNFALGAEADHLGAGPSGNTGISVLAGPQDVLGAVREIADAVLSTAGAGVVVEYTPEHAVAAEYIAAVYPDAVLVLVDADARENGDRTVVVTPAQIAADVDGVVESVRAALRSGNVQ